MNCPPSANNWRFAYATTIERSATGIQLDEFIELCSEAYQRKELPVRLLGVGVRFIDLRENNRFVQMDLFDKTA
jgi:DNA polymerase-4